MSTKNEKGFSPLILILIIILILLLGGVGWLVMSKDKTDGKKSTPTANTSSTPTETEVVDPTKDWKTFTGINFSVKYPDGYSTQVCDSGGSFVSLESTTTGHIICNSDGGAGGTTMIFQCNKSDTATVAEPKTNSFEDPVDFGLTLSTINGLSFDRRRSVINKDPEALGPSKGTKLVEYSTRVEAKTLNCSMAYSEPLGANSKIEDFDQIAATFKVL